MSRFADRVVLVTGGGSGIGAAIAHRFANEGATVVVVGRKSEKLEKTAAGTTMLVRVADVTVPVEVEALIAGVVADLGHLDVLVNNAGAPAFGAIEAVTPEQWRATMAINLDALYHTSRAAIGHLRDRRGCIVNIGSGAALGGDYNMVAYNVAKGAVVNLTRAMALDHAPEVRVNAVHPGFTRDTGITGELGLDHPIVTAFEERIPFGRTAEADEIAAVVAFLAGPDASYVTGAQIPVDGGVSATSGQPRIGI